MPIGLVLLLLTGIGPLLAWRKSTLTNLREQFLFSTVGGLAVGGLVIALGVQFWSAGLCFGFAGFVMGTIAQEFWRGARVRQETTGTDVFTALIGLVGRNKRRYGGYIVHVGIVLMVLGFAGERLQAGRDGLLKPGQSVTVGDFTVRFDGAQGHRRRPQADGDGAHDRAADGAELTKMYPARWFFRKHEDEPTTEVAIRRTFAEDLYVVLARFDVAQQSAEVEVVVNPLVNWVWFGFGILAWGTLIALLPESHFAFAVARVPAHAATAAHAPAGARVEPGGGLRAARRLSAERAARLAHAVRAGGGPALVCMCGTCGRKLAG